jgi:hypothetical protein
MLHVLTTSYGYRLISDRRSNGCQNVSLTLCEHKLCSETNFLEEYLTSRKLKRMEKYGLWHKNYFLHSLKIATEWEINVWWAYHIACMGKTVETLTGTLFGTKATWKCALGPSSEWYRCPIWPILNTWLIHFRNNLNTNYLQVTYNEKYEIQN